MTDPNRRWESPDAVREDRRRLVQLARRFTADRADAEDAVHEAFKQAAVKQDQLRDRSKWWAWLCRITVHQCLQQRRAAARRRGYESDAGADRPGLGREAIDPVERNERAEMVRRAIDRLPHQQRIAITLRHLEQMPYDKIASIMDVAPTTVRVHVRAARESLRVALVEPTLTTGPGK